METRETKQSTIPMVDATGKQYTVTKSETWVRFRFADNTWSEWTVESTKYMCGTIPVNQLEDALFELADLQLQLRPGLAKK